MTKFMQSYFNPELHHTIYIPGLSNKGDSFYMMLSIAKYGEKRYGTVSKFQSPSLSSEPHE